MKRATDEVQDEVMALTKQLNSLRKDTEEFKVYLAHTHHTSDSSNCFSILASKKKN